MRKEDGLSQPLGGDVLDIVLRWQGHYPRRELGALGYIAKPRRSAKLEPILNGRVLCVCLPGDGGYLLLRGV